MTVKRMATSLALSSLLALAPSAAMAQDEASIDNTGPNSNNTVTINNNQSYTENNNQDVTVNNTNNQTATSGDCDVENNTTGGDCTTGDATNNNTTTTTVSFGGGAGGGDDDDGGAGGGKGGGKLPGGGGSSSGGKGGGSLSGALGKGGGLLPDTGAEFPIDVSALRRAISGVASEDLAAVNRTKGLSAGLLAAAALMSLLGAAGSAVYAAKRESL